jgi:hypothetical protein
VKYVSLTLTPEGGVPVSVIEVADSIQVSAAQVVELLSKH